MTDVRVDIDGCSFRVALDGPEHAPCVVLSHSLGARLEMWEPQVAAWSPRFRLVRYDTRGHGETAVTPGPYTISQLGSDVLRLLDALDVERAHFCGLSMGGATALWLAAHAADRFERFVICNTLPWLGAPGTMLERAAQVRRDGLAPLVEATMQRWFTAEFAAREPQTVGNVRRAFLATPREGYAACCEALAAYDEREHLTRITRPVLVVAGTHDPSPPLGAAKEYASAIAGARFVELPAAHLSNLGAAEEFNRVVGEWLGSDQ
jgi:3-oxoadipate enol-lactonase